MLQPVSETQDCTMMYCTSFIAENLHRYTVFKVRRLLLPSCEGGGDNEIRTHDPLLARQVLSQLSYTPELAALSCRLATQN